MNNHLDQLHPWQRQTFECIQDVITNQGPVLVTDDGSPRKQLVLDIAPGGGKTGAFTIAMSEMIASGMCNVGIHFTPRINLCKGMEEDSFHSERFNPHGVRLAYPGRDIGIVATQSFRNDRQAISTTYHSTEYLQLWRDVIRHAGSAVIALDEFHFLSDKQSKKWSENIASLASMPEVKLIVAGTGTMTRSDGEKLMFTEYSEAGLTGERLPQADIVATVRQLVAHRVIRDCEFNLRGGRSTYRLSGTGTFNIALDEKDDEKRSRALRAFLSDWGAVQQILDEAIAGWLSGRGARSRMIVCAHSRPQAVKIVEYLSKRYRLNAVLAISGQTGDDAQANARLDEFRRGSGDVLVTVNMAYIGMDVPDLTDMVFLRDVRWLPYMLQALARILRYDRSPLALPYLQQLKRFWGIADGFVDESGGKGTLAFVRWFEEQRRLGVKDREESERPPVGELPERAELIPIDATVDSSVYGDMHGNLFSVDEADEAEQVRIAMSDDPVVAALPKTSIARIIRSAKGIAPRVGTQKPVVSLADQKKMLSLRVQRNANRLDRKTGSKEGYHNKLLYREFGPRNLWMPEVYSRALEFLAHIEEQTP